MKILRVIARLNVGGPARHVALLDAGLQARGHQTMLVHGLLDTGEASLEHLASELGIPTARNSHLGRRVSATSDLRALASLIAVIFRQSPDVVHTHTAKAGTLGRVAALLFNATRPRARRCLVVHTFHGHVLDGYFSPTMNRVVRGVERLLARATDRVVTISPAQRRDIVERFHIAPAAKTDVVPLGLDLQKLFEVEAGVTSGDLRGQLGIGRNDIVVGYAGRMVPIKDLGTLVRAFALAEPRLAPARGWLLLAGDGPAQQPLRDLAADLGIAERVRFIGWTDDLPRLYGSLDLFALSSLNEGTPVAVIEAMAAARPVVATAVGGVGDVVDAGVSGLLVPPRQPEAMADVLVRLGRDAGQRQRMGASGRERARLYSHDRLVNDIERLYLSALAAKRHTMAATPPATDPGQG